MARRWTTPRRRPRCAASSTARCATPGSRFPRPQPRLPSRHPLPRLRNELPARFHSRRLEFFLVEDLGLRRYRTLTRMLVPATAALALLVLAACSKKPASGDVVARVNGKAI